MGLYKIFEEGFDEMKKNSPLVFAGLACFGVVATSVVSILAGKKLQQKDEKIKKVIEDKKAAGEIVTRKESLVMHVREKWPTYMPVALTIAGTGFCIIKGYKAAAKQIAGLTIAVNSISQSFESYKKATKKILGEKEEEIKREQMKQDILEHPGKKEDEKKYLETKKQEIATNQYNGVSKWWDPLVKQEIYCTATDLVKSFEETSYKLKNRDEEFIQYSEFLYTLSRYTMNDINYDSPEAQEAGWSYEKFSRGIPYALDTNIGVWVNGIFTPQICFKACWQVTNNEIDYMP